MVEDDKVDDFIDVNKFNEEVDRMRKEGKVFDKPINKEYGLESYTKIIDKLFEGIPVSDDIKQGVLKGMMEMLKASKIFEHMSPEAFEKLISSVIRRPNNPDFLTGMFGPNFGSDGIFGSGGVGIATGKGGLNPFEIKQSSPPPQIGKMFEKMFGDNNSDVMKLSGKLRDSHISIEITDEFTFSIALEMLEEYGTAHGYDDEYESLEDDEEENEDADKS